MLELVRKHPRFFVVATLLALGLRLFFVLRFPAVVDDSRLYANIGENWLHHGVYAVTDSGRIMPTLSRLPGYPAFLAAVFSIFGDDRFRAVLLLQVLFDLGTCFLIADLARRLFSDRAAQAAFLLAAVCPFLANYGAAALTECLEIFFTTLALDVAVGGRRGYGATVPGAVGSQRTGPFSLNNAPRSLPWLGCGFSIGAAILLRPDGGLLLAAFAIFFLWLLLRSRRSRPSGTGPRAKSVVWVGMLVAFGALAPLVPWTLRNLRTLHRFEPLAPRYANDSDELVMTGFNRWTKTWIVDYVSVEELYWNVPGDVLDGKRLPLRAFDSAAQRQETLSLFADYNHDHDLTPELDARFAALASARIKAAPLRYYVRLPIARVVDMWMRPRTELLPPDPRWWERNDTRASLAVSFGFGLLNLLYVGMAVAAVLQIVFRSRWSQPESEVESVSIVLFVLFLLLRSVFLGTLENPEPRYTLECYPVIIVLASAILAFPRATKSGTTI